ncbi:alpha carbonic anhydrase, partial [Cladochytrium replicatum]
GATGPDEWPGLCRTGKQQSPINIVGDSILSGTQPLVFRWSELVYNVTYTNTGILFLSVELSLHETSHNLVVHLVGTTLRATLPPNDPSHVIKNGVRYYLIQFHLHNPSEHRFDGFNAALEMHFVHASPEGELLVVALLLDPKAQTRQSPRFYTEFIDLIADEDTTPRNPEESVVLGSLERANPAPIELGAVRKVFGPLENKFFAYLGSFTTPPCTEGVRWLVYRFMVHIPVRNLFAVQHVSLTLVVSLFP